MAARARAAGPRLSQPAAFTFASHSQDEESDDDAPGGPEQLQTRPPLRRSSVGATTTTTTTGAATVTTPGAPTAEPANAPPLARARTSVTAPADENAPANDVPFEEIAALLASRHANNSAVDKQVKPKLKVSASGKFEDQFYHAHEGSRAMGKLKNRTYLKQQDKKADGSQKTKKNANVNGKDVEQFSDSDIIYSGYLVKQGSFWKTWRRRYFILRRDVPVLSYYDSAEELTKLGEITVDGSTSVKPTPRDGFPFQFVVEHETRKLTLVAEQGKPSTDAWITNIQQLIQRRAQEAENARLSVLRQSGERQSHGLRLSEATSGSFLDERPSSARKNTVGVHAAGRDSPHGGGMMMKRFSTDSVAIAGAMQESIAAREEEERSRERHLRQSRATNMDETMTPTTATTATPTAAKPSAAPTSSSSKAVRHDSIPPSSKPRRFRSFSAGSVLSTRSIDYEPMRPRDDFGLVPSASRSSHDASVSASASGYPVNEHPQTRAPCLSLPAFKPGPSLELAVSVGSKGSQEAPHMVVVMSTVAPGKEPRELSRTEMQGALTLRPCGSDFFARDFNAALSIPLGAKDVLHFEIFAFKNPGTEVLASQLSLGFVRISPVDVMLSRDSTIVLECHRSRNSAQLLFLMLDRIVPSESINLGHAFTYAKRHFITDIVPVEATPAPTPTATPTTKTTTTASEKLVHSTPISLSSGGMSYNEMVRGNVASSEANHVFISEELSSSHCSISVALAYLRFAQARNKGHMTDARAKISDFEHKFGPAPVSPTHKTQSEYDAFHDAEAQLARYSRLRDVYRTCEDYCAKLQTMLEDGKEPGVTGSLKRSVQKKDLYTEFMPTNVNVHLTRAKRVVLSSGHPTGSMLAAADSTLTASAPVVDEHVHTVITHGCTAAHVLGFKDGGLRRLLLASAQSPRDEKLLEKIEQRQDVVRSQVLAVASAAFLTVLGLAVNSKSPVHMDRLKLICSTGFLISIESLLSTVRNEKGMIEDMVEGVKWLNTSVSLQVTDTAALAPSAGGERSRLRYAKCVDVSSAASGSEVIATFALPSEIFAGLPDLLKKGDPVKLHAVMFTQGINEMQSVANTMLDTRLQDEINYESVQMLDRYFRVFQSFVKYNARHNAGSAYNDACVAELPHLSAQLAILLVKLNVAIKPHVQKKNVNILLETSDICRRLGAGRTTCCKSGKDRTAMSVTLESSQILVDKFHVKQGVHLCAAMRERGVRRVNVLANTGKDKYAFNSFQLKYIPECYKPPTATTDSHVAS